MVGEGQNDVAFLFPAIDALAHSMGFNPIGQLHPWGGLVLVLAFLGACR